MIFNSDLHHICPHLLSETNAQLSYLSSGQMSLSSSQMPTNATNIIFEPHLDCICLTSNLFFRPVEPGTTYVPRQDYKLNKTTDISSYQKIETIDETQ